MISFRNLVPLSMLLALSCAVCAMPAFAAKPGNSGSKVQPASSISQRDLAEVIIAGALDQMYVHTDSNFHAGEFNHNINLSRIVVQGDVQNLHAYENAAWLLWSTTRNKEAIAFLKQGIAANPDSFSMYDELGAHYLSRLKDAASALPWYQKATTFTCPFITWHGLAHCYEATGQMQKAVDAWQYAVDHYPGDPSAAHNLQECKVRLDKQLKN